MLFIQILDSISIQHFYRFLMSNIKDCFYILNDHFRTTSSAQYEIEDILNFSGHVYEIIKVVKLKIYIKRLLRNTSL